MAKKSVQHEELAKLEEDFSQLRTHDTGKERIKNILEESEKDTAKYLSKWYAISKEAKHVYPSQGLLTTPFDYLEYSSFQILPQEKLVETLRMRRFFLEMFNHPYRVHFLREINLKKFAPPPKVECRAFDYAFAQGLSLSIGDLGAGVVGAGNERISRKARYAQGPFIKLGRYARTIFVGSESPDIWNSAPAIATMAASHCLAAIPRNGVTSDIKRQTDLARESLEWLEEMSEEILDSRSDREELLNCWKRNVIGTVEAIPEKVLARAESLYKAGIRGFRVYSPEPGTGTVDTVKVLRDKFGEEVEIFTGQIVDVEQAKKAEDAGADGLYIGIGGGGRCITGVRSGSAIEWPELLWKLRGEVDIPVIVQGGASDHIAVTLLLGASGIGVTRVVGGGTIETPGGALYCSDSKGRLFKPYGGEASARTKYLDKKLMPFNIPAFVEGETTRAELSYIKHVQPTLTYNLHMLIEDSILALVFRGVESIEALHKLDPSPIKRITTSGDFQRNSH